MRAFGALLVLLGGFVIAVPQLGPPRSETVPDQTRPAEAAEAAKPENSPLDVPPVYGGIAVVSGLLMIAGSGRRE